MGVFAAVRAYAIRPYIFYHLFAGHAVLVVVVVDYSPTTVGAYRIRPDVGGNEMMTVNNASLV